MSSGYGSNQYPQYPGSNRRTSTSSSANPSSLNNLNASQSFAHHPASNVNSYVQYPAGHGYSQGLSIQNNDSGSTTSHNRDIYGRQQYPTELGLGGPSYNSPVQPSGAPLGSLYNPLLSNNTLLQQNLGINSGGGLNQDSYLSPSLGTTCPNPSHTSEPRPSHGVVLAQHAEKVLEGPLRWRNMNLFTLVKDHTFALFVEELSIPPVTSSATKPYTRRLNKENTSSFSGGASRFLLVENDATTIESAADYLTFNTITFPIEFIPRPVMIAGDVVINFTSSYTEDYILYMHHIPS
ncbi:hypothetical protein PCASD_07016 [Puccinia coronata f. sp. avenae]|uniref:Uncharacterized protein n=1 Tax=Puccinia coronata f. sp. avenae TaxID=200324 RepID=A0A2N5UZN1_9BASI|nr:hypothetical protein PCASD_07016 [Puccinia coronata f. sp. avenae]